MDGFQYTDGDLDFFPHAEGYVKVNPYPLGGQNYYNYVYTYTNHLGNIRLKYAAHPQTGVTTILEEDHYYPYGLKHEGYNGNHLVIDQEVNGTPTIVSVDPFLGDSHKYKFGGMEYQDEFDINIYDFGARNYDPALGRWMNIDPLAEMMRRHSPYNYAFNNPVYFIDPDGMIPIPGGSGLLVSDTKYLGTSDTSTGGFGVYVNAGKDESTNVYVEKNGNLSGAVYESKFRQLRNDLANADVSLGGGGCPDGDCGGNNPLLRHEEKAIHTIEEWANRYDKMSLYEIATEGGWKDGQPVGPKKEWRYIKAPDGNVMDMRHVVIVGYIYGEAVGNLIESGQDMFERTRESARDPQDYYSNKIGAYFYQLRHTGSWSSSSFSFDFRRFMDVHYRILFNNYKP